MKTGKWIRPLLIVLFIIGYAVYPVRGGEGEKTFDLKEAGVSYDLPESFAELKGIIRPAYGYELETGSGVYVSGLLYYAMTEEKYSELVEKSPDFTDEEKEFIISRTIDLVYIFAIDGGRDLEDLGTFLSGYGMTTVDYSALGTAGDYNFYYKVNPEADTVESRNVFDEGFREEFDSLLSAFEDTSWIRIYEPVKPENPENAAPGSEIVFETTDLEGNTVNSADIFSQNKITMVNIWGTFCGPCIGEMPDLEVLSSRLGDKDCGIIGIVCDIQNAEDTAHIESAKEIINDTGVTYLNLIPWAGFTEELPAMFIPTTYFIDTDGIVIGEAAVGARGADDYEALLDELLNQE